LQQLVSDYDKVFTFEATALCVARSPTNAVHEPVFIKRQKDFDVVGRVRRAVLDL
jgi:hypothetical protein